eukprot:TRINITY_DN41336_c0_g2_i2.p1 TRINITY_DN41336_c0_g2~~TRINITY_DN41336_c0_g2_i2.p1  ORF type:complete len:457 (+),score=111.90 TRINITY_DN41336_c0_g2_i2:96-1373(+)
MNAWARRGLVAAAGGGDAAASSASSSSAPSSHSSSSSSSASSSALTSPAVRGDTPADGDLAASEERRGLAVAGDDAEALRALKSHRAEQAPQKAAAEAAERAKVQRARWEEESGKVQKVHAAAVADLAAAERQKRVQEEYREMMAQCGKQDLAKRLQEKARQRVVDQILVRQEQRTRQEQLTAAVLRIQRSYRKSAATKAMERRQKECDREVQDPMYKFRKMAGADLLAAQFLLELSQVPEPRPGSLDAACSEALKIKMLIDALKQKPRVEPVKPEIKTFVYERGKPVIPTFDDDETAPDLAAEQTPLRYAMDRPFKLEAQLPSHMGAAGVPAATTETLPDPSLAACAPVETERLAAVGQMGSPGAEPLDRWRDDGLAGNGPPAKGGSEKFGSCMDKMRQALQSYQRERQEQEALLAAPWLQLKS